MTVTIGRRELLAALGGAAAGWPLAARAQQTVPVVGFLRSTTAAGSVHLVGAFRQGLNEGRIRRGSKRRRRVSLGRRSG
jgi:putative ABC transport system substrate-binding protein